MEQLTPERILQLGFGFWPSKVLLSAVELGVFTELSKGPGDLDDLTQRLGLHPRCARDFLDALVALGLLQRRGGRYSNTPESGRFLDQSSQSSIGGLLKMANARLYRFWGHLTDALCTGKPQNEAKTGKQPIFDALYADESRVRAFLSAMTALSRASNVLIAAKFPWADYQRFVDAGTGQGGLAVQVALAHPHLTGLGLDLPPVEPIFDAYIREHGLQGRVRFLPGDLFQGPLPQTDVVMMGHVLHNWGLEEKKLLIRKAYDAVPSGGALIAYDALIDDDRSQNLFGLLMSLNMTIETETGFDYTGADCIEWMREAGFRRTYVESLAGPDAMVVGIK